MYAIISKARSYFIYIGGRTDIYFVVSLFLAFISIEYKSFNMIRLEDPFAETFLELCITLIVCCAVDIGSRIAYSKISAEFRIYCGITFVFIMMGCYLQRRIDNLHDSIVTVTSELEKLKDLENAKDAQIAAIADNAVRASADINAIRHENLLSEKRSRELEGRQDRLTSKVDDVLARVECIRNIDHYTQLMQDLKGLLSERDAAEVGVEDIKKEASSDKNQTHSFYFTKPYAAALARLGRANTALFSKLNNEFHLTIARIKPGNELAYVQSFIDACQVKLAGGKN